MADPTQDAVTVTQEIATSLITQAEGFVTGLMRPWNLYQLAIAAGLLLLATLLARPVGARYHNWLRSREDWPKWRLRFALLIHRRLRLILFVALIWPLIWVMREVTWPSRSYLLAILGSLAFAWLVIALLTRLIANNALRSLVRLGGWIWVTLFILNLTGDAQGLLESIGVSFGSPRGCSSSSMASS